jgi:hypothetical protein
VCVCIYQVNHGLRVSVQRGQMTSVAGCLKCHGFEILE